MMLCGSSKINRVLWAGRNSIRVDFSTPETAYLWQLYAGRRLIGQTKSPDERSILAPLQASLYPVWLSLLAVDGADIDVDHGSTLPQRPYNRARFTVSTSSWPSDTNTIEVAAATEPGGAVDPDNVVASAFWDIDRSYEITTPCVGPSGTWAFEVAGRDEKEPDGNRGTPLSVSLDILTQPPDVAVDSTGNRFTPTATGSVLSVPFTYQV